MEKECMREKEDLTLFGKSGDVGTEVRRPGGAPVASKSRRGPREEGEGGGSRRNKEPERRERRELFEREETLAFGVISNESVEGVYIGTRILGEETKIFTGKARNKVCTFLFKMERMI